MDPETGTMVRTGLEMVINPLDLYAVEEAVQLKERASDGVCATVISMGPPSAVETIREAIAMGCDNGIHLCSREFAGSDTWATAYTLAQAIQRLDAVDLILCGERATDGETGQVGPMVGTILDIPVLTYASRLETRADSTIVVQRAIEGGHETVEAPLPALVSVVKEINEPRLPTLRGKITAREADVPVWNATDLEADEASLGLSGSPTRVVEVFYPTLTRTGEIVNVENSSIKEALQGFVWAAVE